MTVELKRAFVGRDLHYRIEQYLRRAWAQADLPSSCLKIRWVHQDPGKLIVRVILERTSVEAGLASATSDDDGRLQQLVSELEEQLIALLKAHKS